MWSETVQGKTVYRERLTDPITGQIKNFSVRAKKETAQGRKEALQHLFDKISAWNGKEPSQLTLKALMELYEADLAKTVRESTAYRYKTAFNRILRIIGDVNVQNVTAGYIRKKLIDLKPVTANEYIKRIGTMFRWAYRNGYIDSTQAVDRLTYFKEPPHRLKVKDKFLEASDALKVIEALPEAWALVCHFQILTGLRFGELAGLNDEHVKDDRIEVRQAYDVLTHKIHETKTLTSIRDVPVNDELRALIPVIRAHSAKRRMIYSSHCKAFFISHTGGRIQIAAFNKALKQACIQTIGRPLTSHALRHSFASLLMENHVELATIMRALGHQSSTVTKQIYLHVTEELKRKDAQAFQNISLLEKNGRKMGENGKNRTQELALSFGQKPSETK